MNIALKGFLVSVGLLFGLSYFTFNGISNQPHETGNQVTCRDYKEGLAKLNSGEMAKDWKDPESFRPIYEHGVKKYCDESK